LGREGGGSIVWLTDSIAPEEGKELAAWSRSSPVPVRILAPLQKGTDLTVLEAQAGSAGIPVISVTPDDADVRSLARDAKFSNAAEQGSDRWRESGYWLTPLLVLLALPFFRRGWMIPVAARG
jgi:Ca-activated chloride channel family protein